jgi:opacity protein-like surface antigen
LRIEAAGIIARMPRRTGAWIPAAVAAAVVAAVATEARAQSCGGCAGPGTPGGAAQRTWLEEGGWSARLTGEYEVKDQTYKGHHRVPNDFDETLRIHRINLAMRYGLDDDWTLGLDLTDPEFQYRLKPPGGERTEIVVHGPGDTIARAGRRIYLEAPEEPPAPWPTWDIPGLREERLDELAGASEIDRAALTIWAGVSIPTGDVKKPNPAYVTNDFSVTNLQTGTGTFDPLLQARVDVPLGVWRLFTEASAVVPLVENRHDYKTAQTLSFGVGAEFDVAPQLHVRLAATFQRVGNDEYQGEDVGVGGGKWVYVTPGLAWDLTDRLTLDVGVRCTAFRDTDTKLVDSGAAIQVGLTLNF